MDRVKILLALVLTAAIMFAQTVTQHPGSFNYVYQMDPGSVPTSSKCIVGFDSTCVRQLSSGNLDPYLCAADFAGTGQTITLQDVNGIPWIVNGGTLGAMGAPAGWEWHAASDATCRKFPGGVYLVAGSSGATGSMVVKYSNR